MAHMRALVSKTLLSQATFSPSLIIQIHPGTRVPMRHFLLLPKPAPICLFRSKGLNVLISVTTVNTNKSCISLSTLHFGNYGRVVQKITSINNKTMSDITGLSIWLKEAHLLSSPEPKP